MRSHARIVVVALLAGAAMVAGASGTGEDTGAGDDQVDLRVYTQYTDESETVPMDYAVEEMATVMPEVDLEIEVRARDDNQKIKTYAAAGALPDIFDANADIIETFRRSNNILPLNEYVEALGVEEKLSPAMRDLMYHDDGNIYAIPVVGPWVALMYYNKAVFDRYNVPVPTNYDEFLSAVETFAANDVIPVSLFAKEKWPGVQLFDMVATRFDPRGIVALDADQALMSDAPYRNAVARFVELIDAGIVVPGAFSTGYDQAYAQFVEGRAAMLVNGAWALSSLYDDLGDDAAFFPSYPLADADRMADVQWNFSGGASPSGFAVSPYSENVDTAARYAVQLALAYAEGGTVKMGFPPVVKDSPDPEDGYNPLQRAFWDGAGNIETNTTFAWGLGDAQFKTALEDNVQKLLAGTMSETEFIEAMDRAIQAQ